jgi:hypothetical protein
MARIITQIAAAPMRLWMRYLAAVQARDDSDTFFIEL